VVGHPLEVLAEEAGDERQRQEDRRQDRELLHGSVLLDVDPGLLDRDHRHVGLQHLPQELALVGDPLVDPDQVVMDVAQVGPQLLGRGALDHGDHGQQRMDGTVEAGGLAAQRVDPLGRRDRAGEHGGLDVVDVALDLEDDGRVRVHDRVQDRPQHRHGARGK